MCNYSLYSPISCVLTFSSLMMVRRYGNPLANCTERGAAHAAIGGIHIGAIAYLPRCTGWLRNRENLSGPSQKILNKGIESGILALSAGGKDADETANRHTHQRGTKSVRGLCQSREKECAGDYPSTDVSVVRRRTQRARTHQAVGGLPWDGVRHAQATSAERSLFSVYSRTRPGVGVR